MPPNWSGTQLIGVNQLELNAARRYSAVDANPLVGGDQVRCCFRDCDRWLAQRHQGAIGPVCFCDIHGVSVSTKPTYVYQDYRQNFIVDLALLERVKKLKVESWRLGYEKSEDALSWNVFVGLAGLEGLNAAFRLLTGREVDGEPELYLWGVRIDGSAPPQRWANLVRVRQELEAGFSIPTEPDIMLRYPGDCLVLIEAKFGSPNGTLERQKARFGTVSEYLNRYRSAPGQSDPLDRNWIRQQAPEDILEQLCRNVIFAQWLSQTGEQPIVVNLVREGEEPNVSKLLSPHLARECPVRFRRATWECLARLSLMDSEEAEPLRSYLNNKSFELTSAFAL